MRSPSACRPSRSARSSASLGLVEQPHVLDRDHGLVGEGLEQLQLLVGERPAFGSRATAITPIASPLLRSSARAARCENAAHVRAIRASWRGIRHRSASAIEYRCRCSTRRRCRGLARSASGRTLLNAIGLRTRRREAARCSASVDEAEDRLPKPPMQTDRRCVDDALEHRLHVRRRAADHLAGCRPWRSAAPAPPWSR